MADLNTRFTIDDVRSLAFGSIVAGYTAIGGPLDYPAVQIVFQNLTDVLLSFSTDGINEKLKLPPNGYWNPDITSNQQANRGMRMPFGTTFYVRRIGIPTSGTADIIVCYAK